MLGTLWSRRPKLRLIVVFIFPLFLSGCSKSDYLPDGRLHLTYWEKWTGFEFDAMQKVVDQYNESQNRVFVELLSTSQIERKLTVAIAGGTPPDIAGLFSEFVPVFADQNAMLPLDGYLERFGKSKDEYIEGYWKKSVYHGYTWAIPTCGAAIAWHYNKGHFRDAGLDPVEDVPVTLDELVALEEKLNIIEDGRIEQVAYIPSEPPPSWWPYMFVWFFGGELWDGEGKITLTSPEVVEAYEWVAGYSERLGVSRVQAFSSGFGKLFASPQNPFLAGKVSSVIQGNWMHTFVEKYNPGLEFGVAPIPTKTRDLYGTSLVECDVVFIPNGVRHPDESFEFIQYLTSQEATEQFNSEMRSINPRRVRSPEYTRNHPNPNIELFDRLAMDPKAKATPLIPIWTEMLDEMRDVFERIWLHRAKPYDALQEAQDRLQNRLDREMERWRRVGPARTEEWDRFVAKTREGKMAS